MKRRILLVACLFLAATGCLRKYTTFSGRVFVAKPMIMERKPIVGAEITLFLPTRIFRTVSDLRGRFLIKYNPGGMNIKGLTGWVVLVEHKAYFTDLLRIGRFKGFSGRVRKHNFLLVENRTGEDATLMAFQKALRYLGESSTSRQVFALNAIGILAARSIDEKSPDLMKVRRQALSGVSEILEKSENVEFRRLAARKMSMLGSMGTFGPLGKALDDVDPEVVYWAVRSLGAITGQSDKTFSRLASHEKRNRSVEFFKKFLADKN